MTASPETALVRAFLARAARRLAWLAATEGAALGLLIAAGLAVAARTGNWPGTAIAGIGACLAGVGALTGLFLARTRRHDVARAIERRLPSCRNVLITAAELIGGRVRTRPEIGTRICTDAARRISGVVPGTLFSARRAGTALVASTAVFALTVTPGARPPGPTRSIASGIEPARIDGFDVTITPPAHTGRPPVTEHEPSRIEAIEGSRIRVEVSAAATGVSLETLDGRQSLDRVGRGRFAGEFAATRDGYLAIEPAAADGRPGARRLAGVTITPDALPRVRLTEPARDLFLPDASGAIDVVIEADDDIGLASLELRYTRVSGSGEQFTFTEGTIPLRITRSSGRQWNAQGVLRLPELGLAAGDMIVYRGVAADNRPAGASAESDSWIVEITAPGAIAAGGFTIDDERDRYAISQQMVILKTEQLIARRSNLPADSVAEQSMMLAAEQRLVRAEFVFMMGGEVAEDVVSAAADIDESAEAEAEGDILAGRLANRGRVEMIRAIRSMSAADAALTATDLVQALRDERAALTHLQGAFARTRYILRALTQRERLDLSRRLSGELAGVTRDVRSRPDARTDPTLATLRSILSGVASLAGAEPTADGAASAASLARQALRVDPASTAMQRVSALLSRAAVSIDNRDHRDAGMALDSAAAGVADILRSRTSPAPPGPVSPSIARMQGALADALRAAGSR